MNSKRFKLILIGLLLSVLIYVGAALLNNFTGNELLAVLIVAAVICAYPLLSLFRALFSHEAREVRLRQNAIKNTLRWALSNAPLEYKHLKERYFNADRHDAPTAPAPSTTEAAGVSSAPPGLNPRPHSPATPEPVVRE